MAGPKKGEPGYEQYREEYNERRRKRLMDPDFKAKEVARQKASKARLKKRRRQENWERRYGKEG